MSRHRARGGGAPTGEQLREAERGFLSLLRAKGFPAAWIDRNAIDLLAQASSEYAAWMQEHEPEERPVGWLITCAYRRAINLLEAQRRRPPAAAIEDAIDLADAGARTPEEEALENDRQRRLREAIGCLDPKEQRLISLVYFEGRSVREAGRRLGWRKSSADRHHRSALQRLREIVGEDRSLLSPGSLGLAAWASDPERASGVLARLGENLRRLAPFAEPASAAASGGAGRVLGACGAGLAAAACGLVVAGVHPSLPLPDPGSGRVSRHHQAGPLPAGEPAALPATSPQQSDSVAAHPESKRAEQPARDRHAARRARAGGRLVARPAPDAAAVSSPEPAVEEFGIEEGPVAEQPAEEQETSPAPEPDPKAPAQPPAREASGAQVSEEFGL